MLHVQPAKDKLGHLYADDVLVESAVARRSAKNVSYTVAMASDELDLLGQNRLADIDASIRRLAVRWADQEWAIKCEIKRHEHSWLGTTRVTIHPLLWAHPWTVKEYLEAAEDVAPRFTFIARFGTTAGGTYSMTRSLLQEGRTVPELLVAMRHEHNNFKQAVADGLNDRLNADAVTAQFSFPPEVRVACEQYLLHFVDFLRELGVDATAELKETGEHVLFAVSPKDRTDALGRIQTALSVYLQLPNAQFVGVSASLRDQMVHQRLEMNIHFLKSQLAAAEAQNLYLLATAEAHRYTIDVLGNALSRSTAGHPPLADDPESEDIISGLVRVKKFEGKGFEIDLPELLRRLRNLFDREPPSSA